MFKKIIFSLLIVFWFLPVLVKADGMVVPPPDYAVWETGQKAVIFHEGNQETLIVSMSYQGNAKDFAWIVPTPSRPKVSKSSDELFTALEDLTRPVYDSDWPMPLGAYPNEAVAPKNVKVIETKQIDYYKITVLEANNGEALVKWLKKNGYQYPIAGKYILEDYVKNGWYFTAVKLVDNETVNEYGPLQGQLSSGHALPLRFDFTSKKIVYPMKISSIQAPTKGVKGYNYPKLRSQVLLYVFSDHKQALPMFKTVYAGWAGKEQIKNLAFDSKGNPLLTPAKERYFLTKLVRYMTPSEMVNDLYFRRAADNNTVNTPAELEERGFGKFIILMIISGIILIVSLTVLVWLGRKRN